MSENKEFYTELGKAAVRTIEATLKPKAQERFKAKTKLEAEEKAAETIKRLFKGERTTREKEHARGWMREFTKDETGKARTDAELGAYLYEKKDLKDAKLILTKTLRISQLHAEVPTWLKTDVSNIKENSSAAEFIGRITLFPKDVQEDPFILTREARRLHLSTDWASLSDQGKTETQRLIEATLDRALTLAEEKPQQYEEFTRLAGNKNKLRELMGFRTEEDDLFAGIDTAMFSQDDQKWIQDRVKFAQNNPEAINENLLHDWVDKLRLRLRKINDPTKEAKMADILQRMYDRINRMAEQGRIPSTIMLTPDEVRKILKNPIGFFENYAQEIEQLIQDHGFDSPVVEQRLNRYRLISDYFSSDFYDESKGLQLAPGVDRDQREKFSLLRNRLLENKAGLLRQYSDRLHIMEFTYSLENVADFEKDTRFQGILDRLGDEGAFGSRTHWGGLSEVTVQKIRRIHAEILQDPETAKQLRSGPDIMKTVVNRAARELYEERKTWEPQYKLYLEQLINTSKDYIQTPAHTDLDQITCQAIARVGAGSYQLFFEKEQIMARGLPPKAGEAFGGISSFVTANAEEKMLATFRIRDWFFRKWTNMLDGQKAIWNLRALYHVHRDPELGRWAGEKTDVLWTRLEAWKKHYADMRKGWTGKGGEEIKKNDIKKLKGESIFAELQVVFSEYEDKLKMKGFHEDPEEPVKFFTKLPKDELYHYVACDIGGEWAQMHATKAYGFWESGVRRGTVYGAIEASPKYGPHKNELFLGKEIIDDAKAHFDPGTRHRSEEKKQKFVKTLDKALPYHPHTFKKMQVDELHRQMGEPEARQYREASRRFDMLQSQLMLRAEAPIDYSKGYDKLSDAQKKTVDNVFGTTVEGLPISKEQYFEIMKGYVRELSPYMNQFAHVRYASAFSFLLWTDDIPLSGLEMPNLIQLSDAASTQEQEDLLKAVPLSRQVVERGRGRNGLWRRAWADFTMATGVVNAQTESLTPDEKQFFESIVKIGKTIPIYSGHQDAAMAVLEATAGYMEAAKVKKNYTEILAGLKNSSILKEFWGDQAASLGLDEVAHLYDKVQLLLGKLSREAPAYAEALESYTNITSWRSLLGGEKGWASRLLGEERFDSITEKLNEKWPYKLYNYKIRNTILFAAIIIVLFTVSEAKKGGKEAKD